MARSCIDCQATAIKNATMINFVGEQFLQEVVEDYFLDRHLVPSSVRQEVKEKYYHGPGVYHQRPFARTVPGTVRCLRREIRT